MSRINKRSTTSDHHAINGNALAYIQAKAPDVYYLFTDIGQYWFAQSASKAICSRVRGTS